MKNKKEVDKTKAPKDRSDEVNPKGGGRLDGRPVQDSPKHRPGTR